MKKMPSARVLDRLFSYNAASGELIWRERPLWMFQDCPRGRQANALAWNNRFAGKRAFTTNDNGYFRGKIFRRSFLAHRLIWRMLTGECAGEIDHINGNGLDNRLENLRPVSHLENMRNVPLYRANKSGVTGVYWSEPKKKWQAAIRVDGQQVHLGTFTDFNEAVEARRLAEEKYGFHQNHGRTPTAN